MKRPSAQEKELIAFLHAPAIKDNPLHFVMAAYPWGRAGTPLAQSDGPRKWQRDDLTEIAEHLAVQKARMQRGDPPQMFKKATAAGRGPGKSAYDAWLVDWFLTTRIGGTVIVTANTEPQLKSKTFAEISKWTNLLINNHWFETAVLSVKPAEWFGKLVREQLKIDTGYYYAQGQLWSEENPDSFAGAHNPLGMLVLFDEASGIPNSIFTVTQGFFTELIVDRLWIVNSNPRRNSGGFYDCFHPAPIDPASPVKVHPWRLRHLDARTVEGIDHAVFDDLIAKHGIDSDVVRVEVLGQFPKQGDRQFIPSQLVHDAQHRELTDDWGAPLIMGVDPARYGFDQAVVRFRKGRDARSIPPIKFSNRDNMFLANKLAEIIDYYNPDAVNIDAGNGTGIIDRLREKGYKINEVWFGSASSKKEWAFKRTEMWADLREWLRGGCIDNDPLLFGDLTTPEYHYFGKGKDSQILEDKDAIRDRIGRSPDDGDALAMTFAEKVARKDRAASTGHRKPKIAKDLHYPIFGR